MKSARLICRSPSTTARDRFVYSKTLISLHPPWLNEPRGHRNFENQGSICRSSSQPGMRWRDGLAPTRNRRLSDCEQNLGPKVLCVCTSFLLGPEPFSKSMLSEKGLRT